VFSIPSLIAMKISPKSSGVRGYSGVETVWCDLIPFVKYAHPLSSHYYSHRRFDVIRLPLSSLPYSYGLSDSIWFPYIKHAHLLSSLSYGHKWSDMNLISPKFVVMSISPKSSSSVATGVPGCGGDDELCKISLKSSSSVGGRRRRACVGVATTSYIGSRRPSRVGAMA
jgi:hypothetical protein